jgi:hypothetical protein
LRLAFFPALVIFAARASDIPLRRRARYCFGFLVALPPVLALLALRPGMEILLEEIL